MAACPWGAFAISGRRGFCSGVGVVSNVLVRLVVTAHRPRGAFCLASKEDLVGALDFLAFAMFEGWCLLFTFFTLRLSILRRVVVGGLDSAGG